MVTLEEIDQKFRNSFRLVKIDMENVKARLSQIEGLKYELGSNKEFQSKVKNYLLYLNNEISLLKQTNLDHQTERSKELSSIEAEFNKLSKLVIKEEELNKLREELTKDLGKINEELIDVKKDAIKLRKDLDLKIPKDTKKGVFTKVIDTFADEYDK